MNSSQETQPRVSNSRVACCYFSFILFPLLGVGFFLGGVAYYLPVVFTFLALPLMDHTAREDLKNFTAEDFSSKQILIMNMAPILFITLYTLFLLLTILNLPETSALESTGLILSMGIIATVALACSHELFHRRNKTDIIFSRVPTLVVGFMHFEIAHLYSHHRRSGTTVDESTARKEENLYQFLIRTTIGEYKSSWLWESKRLRLKRKTKILGIRLNIWFLVLPCCSYLGLFLLTSYHTLICILAHALLARFLAVTMNYIGHYGHEHTRELRGSTSISPILAWDTYSRFSLYFAFGIPRHSHHHMNPRTPYYLLHTKSDAPLMPYGYPLMMAMATIPLWWRSTMHDRLKQKNR